MVQIATMSHVKPSPSVYQFQSSQSWQRFKAQLGFLFSLGHFHSCCFFFSLWCCITEERKLLRERMDTWYLPAAVSDMDYQQEKKSLSAMHQLHVTLLLLQNKIYSKRPLKIESQSFDNLNSSGSEIYAGVPKAPYSHRRSNLNILDLLPPPPIYAPPSLPKKTIYYPPMQESVKPYYPSIKWSNCRLQSHIAFNKGRGYWPEYSGQ